MRLKPGSPSCRTAIVLTLLPIALAACSPRPAYRPGGDFSARPEKAVYIALREVNASDEQRLKVMAAFDESEPKLRALGDEAEDLLNRWHRLDRRDPAFEQKADEIADRWGALSRERMTLTARFESRVAAVLDPDQWEHWEDFWQRGPSPRREERDEGPSGDEGPGGEGRRRR